MAFECSDAEQVITLGCTELQLYSPKGTLRIEKLTDCSFNLDVTGAATGLSLNMADGQTTAVTGNGTLGNPVITEIKVSPDPNNKLQVLPGQGLYAEGIASSVARNGVSLADNSILQLGNDQGLNTAVLLSHREIPLGGFDLVFSGEGNIGVGLPAGTLPTAKLDVVGTIRSSTLVGTGTRMVVADAVGTMTARAIVGMTFDNNFYVSKKYTGAGAAIVTGYTVASITSVNAQYMTQLQNAVKGSMENTYPDPWAARNAAMDAIAAGTITTALIIVLQDTGYTVGSDVNTNNGTLVPPYLIAGDEVTDVGFSSVNAADVSSLLKNNLYYEFRENSGLYYICHAYNIHLGYQINNADPLFKSSITGRGFFHRVYGEQQGYTDIMIYIDNANAIVQFEGKELSAGMPRCFVLGNVAEFHCAIDQVYCGDSILTMIFTTRATTVYTKYSNVSFRFKELTAGYKQSLYPDVESNDWWTIFHNGVHLFPQNVLIEVENYTRYIDGRGDEHFNILQGFPPGYAGVTTTFYNTGMTYHLKIGNLKEIYRTPVGALNCTGNFLFQMQSRDTTVSASNSTNLSSNNNILIEVRHANIISPILGASCGAETEGVNNVIIFRFDKCMKDNVSCTRPLCNLTCIQGQNVLDRTHLVFEGWFEDRQNHIFDGVFQANSTWGYTRLTLRGKFVARAAGKRVVNATPDTANRINYILDGAMLVNDGSTTIMSAAAAVTQVCTSAVANSLLDANTIIHGNGLSYDSTIGTYY